MTKLFFVLIISFSKDVGSAFYVTNTLVLQVIYTPIIFNHFNLIDYT